MAAGTAWIAIGIGAIALVAGVRFFKQRRGFDPWAEGFNEAEWEGWTGQQSLPAGWGAKGPSASPSCEIAPHVRRLTP